jgi:phosphonate transport system substrate-binding protein
MTFIVIITPRIVKARPADGVPGGGRRRGTMFRSRGPGATGRPVAQGVALALLLLLAACSREEPAVRVDLSVREEVAVRPDAQALTYAYLPQFAHSVSYQRHHRLVEYLQERTGLAIRQVFPDTFDQHMRMVAEGKIDISFSNPFIYVKMANSLCARAFAAVVEADGRREFRSEIIARTDNRTIQNLDDCRGKRWIAVDPTSAGGYLFALGAFVDHGIRREDFAEIAFAPGPGGKQEKVVLAVHAGRYDVGSVREGALAVVAGIIDIRDIKVVARSRWFPGWVYAARRDLDPAVVERVRDALVALDIRDPVQRAILSDARMTGIVPARDADFDAVRDLWSQVEPEVGPCQAGPLSPLAE